MRTKGSDVEPDTVLRISEADLRQYVEGTLRASRRSEIEGFLACNPDLAANVMRAMHQQDPARNAPARVIRQPRKARFHVAALCVACAIAGWAVAQGLDDEGPFDDLKGTPEYVEDAVMSQRVANVRSGMTSQVETPHLNAWEIQNATGIRVPRLPPTWRLIDAQVYPSEEGPSVSLLMENASGRRVNLFAVRTDTDAGETPSVAKERGELAAYWESDGAAYVLTGDGSPSDLMNGAMELSHRALM